PVVRMVVRTIHEFRRNAQMVFQDPYSSLDPRMTVSDIIGEPLDVHHLYSNRKEREEKIGHLMDLVGLTSDHASRYAHEFSGGQRQRIGIARALAVDPKFIVCDEPVSALDVSIQAQIVNMFEDLQKKLGLTYLFIAHDLLVVKHISTRIAVMYLGKLIEIGPSDELYHRPIHPYTISLLSAVPVPDPNVARANKRIHLEGDVPSPLHMPSGCPFRTRCPRATAKCAESMPELKEITPGHSVACHNL
ncbi:MAG: ATP-binding cassette domain-containing protein, partial [Clostridia bacterium]|nr:ATP-binding cassette domain-containing protein [Clostridia bacterium]